MGFHLLRWAAGFTPRQPQDQVDASSSEEPKRCPSSGPTFELISIYVDLKEALSEGSWYQMRNAVRKLRQLRIDMGYSKAEEREGRIEETSVD